MFKKKTINYQQWVDEAEKKWFDSSDAYALDIVNHQMIERIDVLDKKLIEIKQSDDFDNATYQRLSSERDHLLIDHARHLDRMVIKQKEFVNNELILRYKRERSKGVNLIDLLSIVMFNGLDKAISDCKVKIGLAETRAERDDLMKELAELQKLKKDGERERKISPDLIVKCVMSVGTLWAIINHEKVDIFNSKIMNAAKGFGWWF